ncbi:polysaccharide deacetylase family protein [Mesorhizobium sp. NBSH29]|uniref:polysaccharide deacetylase family protein n=1 Tax=Mesorhizobium sp. NBSH29 TaxID=2654249 RepID=UPI0018967FAC|nr:polysaccharide deacetylase family protein [Mesorhizobium sp. NBSH29]QPC87916.1 polysaccharide deacetylase family protein [Mesorhizobium sp. NBSH29]
MTDMRLWSPLVDALGRWERAGRVAPFWLRDDDAVEPTAALDRLLRLSNMYAVPLSLAVIPAHAGKALAGRLADEPRVRVSVHGWAHENHAPAGSKKQELGLHRRTDLVLDELGRGRLVLAELFGQHCLPVLVPPWNRIDDDLIEALPALGFVALSVYGPAKPAALPVINTNVDVMDWHGTRGCRDHAALVADIVAQLDRSFAGGDAVGLLTHHLVHDEAAWTFIDRLFAITSQSRAAVWTELGALVKNARR